MPVTCALSRKIMEVEKPFKEGYLLFPPHGVLGQLKKSWHKKYCQLFKSSKYGIERLEVFDNEEEVSKTSPRIITLENCIKIMQDAQKLQPNVFAIVTRTFTHHFASLTEKEMSDWISAFQIIAFKDDSSRQTIEEDNDLYCSSGEGVFTVNLAPSEASTRCKLEPGLYTLVVASAAIQLRDNKEHHLLVTWPYRYIRRYGCREGKFNFEAGRKCDTGEGVFHLEHSNQQEIFRCISSKMKNMKKLLNGEAPSTPVIACGDNQFQAALSMEARSRSPLPPSPTSATLLSDLDFSAISQSSSKSSASPIIETKPLIINSSVPLIKPKPKPSKPPRKNIQPSAQIKKQQECNEVVLDHCPSGRYRKLKSSDSLLPTSTIPGTANPALSNYDRVEMRKEAWRTMGVTDLTHTERQFIESDTEDETENKRSVSDSENINFMKPSASKILLTQILSKSEPRDDYDKLQHLGSTSKLNNNPGYRHIPAITPVPPIPMNEIPAPPSWNEYDVIDDKMQACRMADDSHHGYGMIRKKSTPNAQNDLGPNHQIYNEQEYAVVQKPKRI